MPIADCTCTYLCSNGALLLLNHFLAIIFIGANEFYTYVIGMLKTWQPYSGANEALLSSLVDHSKDETKLTKLG